MALVIQSVKFMTDKNQHNDARIYLGQMFAFPETSVMHRIKEMHERLGHMTEDMINIRRQFDERLYEWIEDEFGAEDLATVKRSL